MRRFVIALALIVFMAGAANAEGMMFGIKGGLNMANLSVDPEMEVSLKMKLAFGGGVWMNYAVTEAFSVQPELLFMMKGAKYDVDEIDAGFKFNYIDIPILARFDIPMEGDFGVNIFAGPYIAMLMSAKMYMEDEDEDIKDDMKSMDFGLVFGAGFDYALESGCITFDARYSLGLADQLDIEDEDDAPEIKTNGIMIMVGYGFAF